MKPGDLVRLIGDSTHPFGIAQVWVVTNIKSNFSGFWIQIDDDCPVKDVWHAANNYEVVDEDR